MKKFHITITNNETGETLHDLDTKAIVGAILDDDGTFQIAFNKCNVNDMLNVIDGAERTLKHIYKKHPELALFKALTEKEESETEEETDETTEK